MPRPSLGHKWSGRQDSVLAPYLSPGGILGHEFMGTVEEVGRDVTRLSVAAYRMFQEKSDGCIKVVLRP